MKCSLSRKMLTNMVRLAFSLTLSISNALSPRIPHYKQVKKPQLTIASTHRQ